MSTESSSSDARDSPPISPSELGLRWLGIAGGVAAAGLLRALKGPRYHDVLVSSLILHAVAIVGSAILAAPIELADFYDPAIGPEVQAICLVPSLLLAGVWLFASYRLASRRRPPGARGLAGAADRAVTWLERACQGGSDSRA